MILSDHAIAAGREPIILRTAISPREEIWVGQRVDLQVDVLARDGWAQIKTIRDFTVPEAYVVRLETQGTRLSETISGHDYGGQRYELSLFPQQGGRISVPQISVVVEVRRWGDREDTQARQMETPAVEFDVKIPAGAENLRGLISTTELKAQQQWTPRLQEFTVGEALTRTIELSAPDVSGMAFSPLKFPAIDGLGIYPGEPVVADSYSRGSLRGKRTESVTYVFEEKGAFELPAIEIPWWDIDRKELKRIVLPSLEVEISGVPGSGAETASGTMPQDEKRMETGVLMLLSLLLLLSGIAWRFRLAIRSRWQHWQVERRQTEKAHFWRFREACRKNDAKMAYNHLLAWLDRRSSVREASTFRTFLETAGSEKLSTEVDKLEKRLFKKAFESIDQSPWQGRALYRELAFYRNRGMRTKKTTSGGESLLVPLNPP
jgi:hypothetical protein